MRNLEVVIRVICLIPFLTGLGDLWNGLGLVGVAGSHIASVARDPVLNSQVRFWGAIWLGFGVILWHASSRLLADARLFRILCGSLIVAGLARLAAMVQFGSPGPVFLGAMCFEVLAPVLLLVWHARIVRAEQMAPVVGGRIVGRAA